MKALIIEDGLSRQALAAARALAQAGWTVGVGEQIPHGITACSRAVKHRHRVQAPNHDPDGFVRSVQQAIEEIGYEVVFGARDADVLLLSLRRDEIGAVVPYPPHARVVAAMDKESLYAAARSVGISTPDTRPATTDAVDQSELPVMVKARLHASANGSGSPVARLETRPAHTREELRGLVAAMNESGGQPLLQERIPGRLLELSVLCDRDGVVVGHVQQEADAVWPTGAGVAVRAHTVPTDGPLLERAAALAAELGWWGLAELQFLVPEGGTPRLVDFNGRFYGSLTLAVAAGLNTPAMWAAMATGRPMPPVSDITVGQRYQWFFGDFLRGLNGGPGRMRRSLGALSYARGSAQSVFEPRDPVPAVRHMTIVASRFFF